MSDSSVSACHARNKTIIIMHTRLPAAAVAKARVPPPALENVKSIT